MDVHACGVPDTEVLSHQSRRWQRLCFSPILVRSWRLQT
jgi:hypothetical protein